MIVWTAVTDSIGPREYPTDCETSLIEFTHEDQIDRFAERVAERGEVTTIIAQLTDYAPEDYPFALSMN